MVNWKLRQLKKSWLLLPVLWSQNLISITEGNLWKLFHLISQFPKVGVSSCLLKRIITFQAKEVCCSHCKGLYLAAWRGETAARPWEGTEAPAGRQSENIWVVFLQKENVLSCLSVLFQLCSLCLAGLGEGDLWFGAHLCAWMKSECACLEGNVLLFLAVTLLLLIERILLCLIAKITGIFNRPTNSP